MRISKNFISGAKKAYRVTDRFAGKFGRWIVTDHTGFNRALNEMPRILQIRSYSIYCVDHLQLASRSFCFPTHRHRHTIFDHRHHSLTKPNKSMPHDAPRLILRGVFFCPNQGVIHVYFEPAASSRPSEIPP